MGIDKSFLGTGWSFPPEFSKVQKGVKMVSEDEDINESLRILLFTAPGERLMHPTYGCGLKSFVFENMSESTVVEIKDDIERAVLFFEPRISLNDVVVDDSKIYEGKVRIELDYTVRATNSRRNVVYPFYFREGTNIHF